MGWSKYGGIAKACEAESPDLSCFPVLRWQISLLLAGWEAPEDLDSDEDINAGLSASESD